MQEIIPCRTDLCKCVEDAADDERRWVREKRRESREITRMSRVKSLSLGKITGVPRVN